MAEIGATTGACGSSGGCAPISGGSTSTQAGEVAGTLASATSTDKSIFTPPEATGITASKAPFSIFA